jgi:hypothetical protein
MAKAESHAHLVQPTRQLPPLHRRTLLRRARRQLRRHTCLRCRRRCRRAGRRTASAAPAPARSSAPAAAARRRRAARRRLTDGGEEDEELRGLIEVDGALRGEHLEGGAEGGGVAAETLLAHLVGDVHHLRHEPCSRQCREQTRCSKGVERQ